MIKVKRAVVIAVCLMFSLSLVSPVEVSANTQSTNLKLDIYAKGVYSNWDGVSNVAQFTDNNGQYCYAYYKKKTLHIVKTKNGVPQKNEVTLKMKYSLFGDVTCDSEGNYYVVTGRNNKTDDTSVNTIFISKYDSNGKHIKTVGDNGSSSLAYYYDSSFYTQKPFDAGNCEIAVNGDLLAVNYARLMYSGHQSNSVFMVNRNTMEKVELSEIYESHSFAQRTIPFGDGFVFASEGDCYNRAFTIATQKIVDDELDYDWIFSDDNYFPTEGNKAVEEQIYEETPIFDFWVKKNTLKNWDMYTLNNNFVHMGGLAAVNDKFVALVGTSAKALSSDASKQKEQLFIQIFDPTQDLTTPEAYTTTGIRSGIAGPNGNEAVTNYGVQWLTNGNSTIKNPQVVSDGNGKIAVLYEKYSKSKYQGVFYIILDADGNIIRKESCFSAKACLNPCRMPEYSNGKVYWTGNRYQDSSHKVYVYSFSLK